MRADPSNYRAGRTAQIRFLVIHYTANDGDTAAGNCSYFAAPDRGASAHYFVDERGWAQSVADADTAWHCGAQRYRHPECRNANAIGIELCSRKDAAGQYYFCEQTVANAAALTRKLMAQYGIPGSRVLRHYDVTGKNCPAPFVGHPAQWEAFLKRLEEKDDMTKEEVRAVIAQVQAEQNQKAPGAWSAQARAWAEENGLLNGTTGGEMQYQAPCTREQLAAVLFRFRQLIGQE